MSEPLDYFSLDHSPFADEAHACVVIGTRALRKVVSRIQANLRDGASRIGVCGVGGIGKTSLARALPKLFAGNTRTAVIFDPGSDWKSLRLTLARDWQLSGEKLARASLLQAARVHRLVLDVDRAEDASEALLRHLDVLQDIQDENGSAVVTVILFVKRSAESSAAKPAALDWLERSQAAMIPFESLAPDAVSDYIERQLQRAGYRGSPLFTPRAALAIHTETTGVPGEISRLCERLLIAAAMRRLPSIDEPFVRSLHGTQPALSPLAAGESDEAWDDADHHPRETPEEELLLEHAIASPRVQTLRASGLEGERPADPELEAYLSSPATESELRAIRGGFLRRNLWPFAAITCAAAVGGLLLATLLPDESITVDTVSDSPTRMVGSPVPPQPGPVLGRLRGPLTTLPVSPPRNANATSHTELHPTAQIESPLRRAGDFVDDADSVSRPAIASRPTDLEREAPDDRPKDLAPPASLENSNP